MLKQWRWKIRWNHSVKYVIFWTDQPSGSLSGESDSPYPLILRESMQNSVSLPLQQKIQWSLFSLRLGVFIVLFVWTLDTFINPAHSSKIFHHFYGIEGLGESIIYAF